MSKETLRAGRKQVDRGRASRRARKGSTETFTVHARMEPVYDTERISARRAAQALKDAAELARPVPTPYGSTLNLRRAVERPRTRAERGVVTICRRDRDTVRAAGRKRKARRGYR